jgi:S1-C subfamily serine protease
MGTTILELSKELAGVVEATSGSVVRVRGRARAASNGVVWDAEGVIATAHHALERDEEIEVLLPDGKTVLGSVVGRDPSTDLAAVRVAASGLVPPSWGGVDELKVGHLVLALSRSSRSPRALLGVVCALGDHWRTPAGGRLDRYVETDIGPFPGFSGSLVVDASGRGIGLASAGLRRGSSLAVPAPTLARVMASLLSHGQPRRGFLGLGLTPVRVPSPISTELGQNTALIVLSVEQDSPASRAGVLLGDVIVSLDGKAVSHVGDLLPFLDEERVGTAVDLKLVRAGAVQLVPLTIGERAARGRA